MDEERESRTGRHGATVRTIVEVPIILLISFALVFGFVRPVIAESFYVGSGSMEPTLHGCKDCANDRLLINKLAYDIEDPNRGDIALFENQGAGKSPLIKRVVGLPGDTVKIRQGEISVNGKPLEEPYVKNKSCARGKPSTCSFGPVTIPENHYFMMGDNRTNSTDSRFFGPVPEEDLIGEALVRFWPPNRAGGPG